MDRITSVLHLALTHLATYARNDWDNEDTELRWQHRAPPYDIFGNSYKRATAEAKRARCMEAWAQALAAVRAGALVEAMHHLDTAARNQTSAGGWAEEDAWLLLQAATPAKLSDQYWREWHQQHDQAEQPEPEPRREWEE